MEEPYLICQQCGHMYEGTSSHWRCHCGGLFNLSYSPSFDWQKIKQRPNNIWRYREAIPIKNDEHIVTFSEGFTPLLAMEVDGHRIWVKQEHLFQTGSYKDRGASVLISHAKETGVRRLVEDSSGNAGCAIAAYSARAGIQCEIYVPAGTSPAKLAQIKSYGAGLHLIPGTREDTATKVMEAAENTFYASHSWNPWFFQGTKTIAYEIWEQLGGNSPDYLILPVGNGTLLLGAYFGFLDLQKTGFIGKLPKLIGVQAKFCSPLVSKFHQSSVPTDQDPHQQTMAEGIAIAKPVRGEEILAAIRETDGDLISVSELEIQTALFTAFRSGFYIEPTSATVLAAVHKLDVENEEPTIVTAFSGHGLKATEKILSLHRNLD